MNPTIFNWVLIGVGGILANLGLEYGVGFDPGWWGILIWLGLGIIISCVIDLVRA